MEFFSPPRETFLIFQETETPIEFLIFSQEKAFLIFRETELFYISGNGNPKKTSYISGSNFPSPKNEINPPLKSFLYVMKN